jgi:hypothetical protein
VGGLPGYHVLAKVGSRGWIAYKDELCLESTAINHRLEPEQAKKSAEYFGFLVAFGEVG